MRRQVRLAIAALAAAGVVVLAIGWFGKDGRPRAGSQLRVLFTGETMGELEPCNCSGKEAGGLPVRGGFLAAQTDEYLLLDTGCVGAGARDFEILRLKAALRAMAAMKYDAVNIGEHELWLGRDELAEQLGMGVRFVSANVTDSQGEHLAAPFVWLRRSGLRVAVTGLVAAGPYLVGSGLKVDSPVEALARLLPRLRERAGVIIVLADLSESAVRELAQRFPEVTLILYRGRGDSRLPERVNRSVIASVYGEARYIGEVLLSWAEDGRIAGQGEPVLLDERFSPSQTVVEVCVDWYKEAVRGKQFDPAQARPGWKRIGVHAAAPGDKYLGSDACKECHEPSYEIWERSGHARALKTLQRVDYDYSPECLVCHVVGYGAADGFLSVGKTRLFGNVGCESCHGRGHRHVESKGKRKESIVRSDEATCRACHTPKRDQYFRYEKAWARIEHEESK